MVCFWGLRDERDSRDLGRKSKSYIRSRLKSKMDQSHVQTIDRARAQRRQ